MRTIIFSQQSVTSDWETTNGYWHALSGLSLVAQSQPMLIGTWAFQVLTRSGTKGYSLHNVEGWEQH